MTVSSTASRDRRADTCPECASPLVVAPRYSSWCRECGWNLDPLAREERPSSRADRVLARLGERGSDSLQREFSTTSGLRPRLTPAKLAAFGLSLPTHLLTVLLAIGGVLLVVSGNLVLFVGGVIALLMAWVFRLRIPSGSSTPEAPETIPNLTRLAAEVARSVGTRPPDRIVVNGEFNAAVTTSGWRRTRILIVGLPLFAVLGPQERVALLAHEFGHFANGDPRRTFIVGSAFMSLLSWHMLLVPAGLFESENEQVPGVLMFPVNLVMLLLSWIPLATATVLVLLIFRESQRGEYLADAIAARTAGTDALISGWDKLHLNQVFSTVASSSTDEYWLNGSLWDEMRYRAAEVPESEFVRARLRDRATSARLDLTHPPTSLRIDVVHARGLLEPALTISDDDAAAVDRELMALQPRIQAQLIEEHRDSITGPSLGDAIRSWE